MKAPENTRRNTVTGEGGGREQVPWKSWGHNLDPAAIEQMELACTLPVAVRGALMPDAHVGYGLPIGGVLATRNAVVPYAVGVDIACRMSLTVTDRPVRDLFDCGDELARILEQETRFGKGRTFDPAYDHPVLDEDWSFSPVLSRLRDKAHAQLGTSGSGNHFVEFGVLTPVISEWEWPPGEYLAILSHSGSRGAGAAVAEHYWKVAMDQCRGLPKALERLSWLSLDHDAGREYWQAMELMGRYAAANHEIIHRKIIGSLGGNVLLRVENYHNFAWREMHDGHELVVHRKGATPAGRGQRGVIPGSMATPGFLVRGRGEPASLHSAAHGAGRRMSRKAAHKRLNRSRVQAALREAGVHVLSAGLDESPEAYKDIHDVMEAQRDLVDIMARFDPKIVKMERS